MKSTIVALAARTAILALVASNPADAQRDPTKPAGGTGVIQGRIVAADTLAAVQDVTVSLRPADELPTLRALSVEGFSGPAIATARSGPDGRFELAGVAPGRYRVTADPGPTAVKYLPVRLPDPAADESEPLTVSPNRPLDQLMITLPRAAVINGLVVDEGGNPMAFVSVSAQELLPGDRRRGTLGSQGSAARTDDNGAFRLFGLRPGEYVLAAQPPRQGSPWIGSAMSPTVGQVPTTYYPGTTSARDATRVRVRLGEEYGPIRFALHTVRLSTIRGLVLDSSGQPASTVSVSLRSTGPSSVGGTSVSMFSRTTDSEGTLEFTGVPPGEYAASVSHYAAQGSQFGWVTVTIADDVESMTIRLQPGVSVKGRVIFEGQGPAPLPTMYVRGVPTRAVGRNTSSVLPGPDRSFALSDQFGPTFIRAECPVGWHLKSVLLGGSDITDLAVEFAANGPLLEVVLTQRVAALTGIVTTATGVPALSSVLLINEDPGSWHERATTTRSTMTGADGKYRLDGLRAGRYLIVATTWEDGFVPGSTSDYIEFLAKHATRVLVGDGESTGLDLKRITLR
jgi:carboxypeptidase family protein